MHGMRAIGVDIGGTFTDTVLVGDGVHAVKTSSTADFTSGLTRGIKAVCERAGVSPGDVDVFSHGSTIAVNALIEGTQVSPPTVLNTASTPCFSVRFQTAESKSSSA